MFSSALFILLVVIFYIVINAAPSRFITSVFGGLNLVALWLLFGWESAAVVSILTGILWVCLFIVKKTSLDEHKNLFVRAMVFCSLIVLILAVIFLTDSSSLWIDSKTGQASNHISFFLVIGLSYLGLRMWDCMFAVMEGAKLANPIALSGYLMPFFMVMAGPLSSYQDHLKSGERYGKSVGFHQFVDCLLLISIGYAMKFFFAELYQISMAGTNIEWELVTVWDTWLFLIYILLEFWGYSLIALGVGRLIGIATPINFNYPFLAVTFGEFWTRWHMSLGAFVSRNIYNPVMLFLIRRLGSKNKRVLFVSNIVALWLPFIFTGLWHHISWGFFWWGLIVGFIVAAEKALWELASVKKLIRSKRYAFIPYCWKILGVFYTQTMVALTLTLAIKDFLSP